MNDSHHRARNDALRAVCVAIAVAVVSFAAYYPSLSCEFVNLDDGQYVTANPFVRYPSWDKLWTFFKEWRSPSLVAGYYQPLTMASLMLDSVIDGHIPPRPFVYHLTNVMLHALNASLVFVWLRGLFKDGLGGRLALGLPAGLALLFALHPIQVEVVSWVCQRKALLSTTFALGTMIAFTATLRRRGAARWGVALAGIVSFVLSMLAKPTGTLLPIVLAGLAVWPLKSGWRRGLAAAAPYAILSVVFGYVAYVSQRDSMGLAGMTLLDRPKLGILIICHNVAFYLYKLCWPAMLSPQYPLPPNNEVHLGNRPFLIGVVVTVVVVAALLIALKRRHWPVIVGAGGFFVLISPVLGPLEFMGAIAADRFAYLPMLMLLPMIAGLWPRRGAGLIAATAAGAVALVALGVKTHAQQAVWKDSLAYWEQSLQYEPGNPALWEGKGSAYVEKYDKLEQEPDGRDHRELLDKARVLFEKVIETRPSYSRVFSSLSALLILQGDVPGALAMAERGMAMPGFDIEAVIAKARALSRLGRYSEAIEWYQRYLRQKQFDPEGWQMLGQAYSALGQFEQAESCFARVVSADPEFGHGEPHYGLGQSRVMLGSDAQAIEPFREAVRRQPANGQYRLALAACLASSGQDGDAMRELALAIRLWPELMPLAEKQKRFAKLRQTPYWAQLREFASQAASAPATQPSGRISP